MQIVEWGDEVIGKCWCFKQICLRKDFKTNWARVGCIKEAGDEDLGKEGSPNLFLGNASIIMVAYTCLYATYSIPDTAVSISQAFNPHSSILRQVIWPLPFLRWEKLRHSFPRITYRVNLGLNPDLFGSRVSGLNDTFIYTWSISTTSFPSQLPLNILVIKTLKVPTIITPRDICWIKGRWMCIKMAWTT